MWSLTKKLQDILIKNPIGEKILIVPNYSAGREFLNRCAQDGVGTLNLKVETLSSLAEQTCEQELYQSKKLIEADLANEILIGILIRLKSQGDLKYFNSLEVTPGVSRAIYRSLLDLKKADLSFVGLSAEMFNNNVEKHQDIAGLWSEFSTELEKRNYWDLGDLFKIAAAKPFDSRPIMYIVPSNLRMTVVERSFFDKLTKGKFEVLSIPQPKGLSVPQTSLENLPTIKETGNDTVSSLLWLYDLPNAPSGQALPLETFYAYGESNEVKEVFRRIKHKVLDENVRFDEFAVYYTAREPYSTLFYTIAQELNFPVNQGQGISFGQGIDILYTNPGKLFFGLMDWVEGGFKVTDFINLLSSGVMRIYEEKAPSTSVIIRLLRNSSIGKDRIRYVKEIEKELSKYKDELIKKGNYDGEVNKEYHESLKNKENNLLWLSGFFNKFFAHFPEPNPENKFSYSKFAHWFYELIKDFSPIRNKLDGEAKKLISEGLQGISDNLDDVLEEAEAYIRLKALFVAKRIDVSSPQPGAIHIDHYKNGLWINRPYVFVVGLDANRFPGNINEDPILLDLEREKISASLPQLNHVSKEKSYDLIQMLGSITGALTCSYSCFDTVENREVSPAALLLQMHRLQKEDYSLDYSDLIHNFGKRNGFIPEASEQALDESEWWLNKLNANQDSLDNKSMESINQDILNGRKAMNSRNSETISEFDGKADASSPKEDINQIVMSSSKLETLAKCPFRYFLNYVLEIKPMEKASSDSGTWLDAKTLGSLYHAIFERFYKGLTERCESPLFERHQGYLSEIIADLLDKKKEEVPPPNDVIFEYECRIIYKSCEVFLKSEEIECKQSRPKYFELSFGRADDSYDPVKIELSDTQHFLLNGIIDRVDEILPEGPVSKLRVWDYKTGSTYGYSETSYFNGGRLLQHALYPYAIEKLLSEKGLKAEVVESGYIFPTLKGEGKRIRRKQDRREKLKGLLKNLYDFLEKGTFIMTENNDDCKYCDFRLACNRDSYIKNSLKKMKDYEGLRSLREYE